MRWNKLEYGKWPKGRIALRIVSDTGVVQVVVGNIEVDLGIGTYFIECKDGSHRIISIDSIYDTEPHYIELDKLEMPS